MLLSTSKGIWSSVPDKVKEKLQKKHPSFDLVEETEAIRKALRKKFDFPEASVLANIIRKSKATTAKARSCTNMA